MKKITLTLGILLTGLMANQSDQVSIDGDKGSFLHFKDSLVIVYTGEHYRQSKNIQDLEKHLKKGVCTNEARKNIIKRGKNIVYIYIHETNVSIVEIDNCDNTLMDDTDQ